LTIRDGFEREPQVGGRLEAVGGRFLETVTHDPGEPERHLADRAATFVMKAEITSRWR
jgi:hypothetical protein